MCPAYDPHQTCHRCLGVGGCRRGAGILFTSGTVHELCPAPWRVVALAQVEATQEKELAKEHGIKGYPTIKWFVNGNPTEYSGPRDA